MRAQPRLMNALVDYWHPDAEEFMLEGQSLTPMTEGNLFFDWSSQGEGNQSTFILSPRASQHSRVNQATLRGGHR
jgi:hypothetical protein